MKRYSKILCMLDTKSNAEATLAAAVKLADNHQASLTLFGVVDTRARGFSIFSSKQERQEWVEKVLAENRKELEQLALSHAANSKAVVDVKEGCAYLAVIHAVLEHGYDLVVKHCDKNEWEGGRIGSEDMHLLRKCPCPVLLLQNAPADGFRSVMATVDVSDSDEDMNAAGRVQAQLNEAVIETAAAMAVAQGASMHIGSVWDAYGEDFLRYGAFAQLPEDRVLEYIEDCRLEFEERLEQLLTLMKQELGRDAVDYLRPRSRLVKGKPQEQIPVMVQQNDVDLLVMGTVARTGIPGFIIGNTAESILAQVQCSVLAIKPQGFVSPVSLTVGNSVQS